MKTMDSLIKDFEKKSKKAISKNISMWEGTEGDEIYQVDIHIWRKPGMGNSLQTIAGNKLSIMTATASFLQTLMDKDIVSEKELKSLIDLSIEGHRGKLK